MVLQSESLRGSLVPPQPRSSSSRGHCRAGSLVRRMVSLSCFHEATDQDHRFLALSISPSHKAAAVAAVLSQVML
ncbi:hypothetical protein S83_038277 [Arachis hypogaea]